MLENKTRYHLNNHYLENPLPFGNIHLLQLGRRYCESTEIISPHPHLNWFELTVVTDGCGTIISNGEASTVHSGDIYLSFPCDVHEIRADCDTKLEYDFFSFYCFDEALSADLKNFTQNYKSSNKRILRDSKISKLIEYAISEFISDEKPHTESALSDIFHLILIYLVRNVYNVQQTTPSVSNPDILCFQLMNYINTHIYFIEKLEELGPVFNYNYAYLSALFKKTTGKTISEYYFERKMETGKALVLEKKKSISEIAKMLGYDLYSFSKAFKRKYGVSPKKMQLAGD